MHNAGSPEQAQANAEKQLKKRASPGFDLGHDKTTYTEAGHSLYRIAERGNDRIQRN